LTAGLARDAARLIHRDETVLMRTSDEIDHVSSLSRTGREWLRPVITTWHETCFAEDRR
jgi:hypothetical protein